MNSHCQIFDELHEAKDYKLLNVMKNSTASREQPILLIISTAGYQLSGPLVDYYEKGSDVLTGALQDERCFYFIAELDKEDNPEDIESNPSLLYKANPNLGVSIDPDTMLEEWKTRKHIPAERNDFITKRLNVFVQSDEQGFLDYEVLKRNNKEIDLDTLIGRPCVGSLDLSQTEDFTSACLEFILDSGEVFVLSHSWIPEAKVTKDNEKIPYRELERQGLLSICPGDYIDYKYIYDWFVENSKIYSIEKIMYDPANAYRLIEELKNHGFVTEVVRQGFFTLSPALKDAKELFLDGKVIFNNNKLFLWFINNVRLKPDSNGNYLPQKQGRYRKIDGFAAFLNAHVDIMKKMVKPQGNGDIKFISMKDL